MKTIYVDAQNHCHSINDGTMTAVEDDFFTDKCDTFIEGYCYESSGGVTKIYPWNSYAELYAAQRAYERQLMAARATLGEVNVL